MISSSATDGSLGSMRKMLTSPTMHSCSWKEWSAHRCLSRTMKVHSWGKDKIIYYESCQWYLLSYIRFIFSIIFLHGWQFLPVYRVPHTVFPTPSNALQKELGSKWLYISKNYYVHCTIKCPCMVHALSSSSLQLLCMSYSCSRVSGSEAVSFCSSEEHIHWWYLVRNTCSLHNHQNIM